MSSAELSRAVVVSLRDSAIPRVDGARLAAEYGDVLGTISYMM